MASNEELVVDIKDDNDNVTQGKLFYIAFTKADRTKRAITAWAVCWGLAILSIPIILAHYILIPAFLIAGPIIARSRLKQPQEMITVDGECPHHKGPFSLKMEKTDTLPKWAYCPVCDKGLHIAESTTADALTTPEETTAATNENSESQDTVETTDAAQNNANVSENDLEAQQKTEKTT